jgi:hypothetical protein
MRAIGLILGLCVVLYGCSSTDGIPIDPAELGYETCLGYFECGPGRHCGPEGLCRADCRSTADCAFYGSGLLCNSFGQCLHPDGGRRCLSHEDCGENRYCNGECSSSLASCGGVDDCPLATDECEGTCGAHCGNDNDCLEYEEELTCTPVGQCLRTGWEQWIPVGELPPVECRRDRQCKVLGWRWYCDCDKYEDPRIGTICAGSAKSVCVESPEPLDFGSGPESSPAHVFAGMWGLRDQAAQTQVGLPLVGRQDSTSSTLSLVKITHTEGDRLKLETKNCDIQLINFVETDEPFEDLAWMLIPYAYLHSLPVSVQWVEVTSAEHGAHFESTVLFDLRGLILDDPVNDPLPDRHVFEANPGDERFWDQDEDGKVGVTTLMDGMIRGEIYNVQRIRSQLHGIILDQDHIRGPVGLIESEKRIISASSPSLIYDTEFKNHEQEDRTFFRLMRIDDDASCADLIREGYRNDSWLRYSNHMMDVPDP